MDLKMIGDRLKKFRKGLRITQKEMGEAIGTAQTSIGRYERGRRPITSDHLFQLKQVFDVNIEWLIFGTGDKYLSPGGPVKGETARQARIGSNPVALLPAPSLQADGECGQTEITPAIKDDGIISVPEKPGQTPDMQAFDLVPVAEAELNAGGGSFVLSEQMKYHFAFRRDWLRKVGTEKKNLICIFVRGDSMEPTLHDGDVLMIDRGRRAIHSGLIYAIGWGDVIAVKRLVQVESDLVALHSDNPKYPPAHEHSNRLRVIGQIVWHAHQHVRE